MTLNNQLTHCPCCAGKISKEIFSMEDLRYLDRVGPASPCLDCGQFFWKNVPLLGINPKDIDRVMVKTNTGRRIVLFRLNGHYQDIRSF